MAGYQLVEVVDVLNGSIRLQSTGEDHEGMDRWLRAKFRLNQFRVRMHWGVVLLGDRNIPGLSTSESVALVRVREGMSIFYRTNVLQGPQSSGFRHDTLRFEDATVRNIKKSLNALFVRISKHREDVMSTSSVDVRLRPVCPQARM